MFSHFNIHNFDIESISDISTYDRRIKLTISVAHAFSNFNCIWVAFSFCYGFTNMSFLSVDEKHWSLQSPQSNRDMPIWQRIRLMSFDSDCSSSRHCHQAAPDTLRTAHVTSRRSSSSCTPVLLSRGRQQIPDGRSQSCGSTPSLLSAFSSVSTRNTHLLLDAGSQDLPDSGSGISSNRHLSRTDDKSCPFIFLNQSLVVPKLPFCEEFDGVNVRRTATISESITALIASEQKEEKVLFPTESFELDVGYRSSVYFDRLREIHDIIESTTDTVFSDAPCTPVSVASQTGSSPHLVFQQISFDVESKQSKENSENRSSKKETCAFAEFISDGTNENVEVGSVDLKIKYILSRETILVTIIKAEDVFDPDKLEKQINPFIKLSIYQQNRRKKRTGVVRRSRNPVFQETFHLEDVVEKWLHVTCLLVQLYHKKRFGSRCLGETLIWLDDLDLMDENEEFVTEIFRTALY